MQKTPNVLRVSECRRPDYFVVASFVRLQLKPGYVNALPVGVAHAKTYGTTRTLCGLNASSWHRIWEQAFPTDAGDSCRRCLELLGEASCLRRNAKDG